MKKAKKSMKKTKKRAESPIKRYKKILNILIIIMIIFVLSFFIFFIKFTGFAIKEQIKQVRLYFYDEQTNCSLNGYLFFGNELIGKTEKGLYNLSYQDYLVLLKDIDKNITLFGKLGDCFKDEELYFDKSWKSLFLDEKYFNDEYKIDFKAIIKPHDPIKKEMIAFVEPNIVKNYLGNIKINNNIFEDLSSINDYLNKETGYVKDWGLNKENYWQTPLETFAIRTGDCEDFSVSLLSLFLAYNPNLKCYNIVFSNHVSTLCNIDDYYIYYDQQKKEIKKKINDISNTSEFKSELLNLNKEYFNYYGISNETVAFYAFDNNELQEFKTNQDYIDWQYSLMTKNLKYSLFSKLESQYKILPQLKVEYINNTDSTGELSSLKTDSNELPSLKGFLSSNLIMIFSLMFTLFILIILLIRINKK